MKHCLLLLLVLTFNTTITSAQTDTTGLIAGIEKKLTEHSATVSGILSDSSYDIFHSKTAFRELVKKYADSRPLIITSNKEPGKKIIVTGTVKNKDDNPVPDALVYLYQTDARGWYAAEAPHVLVYEGDHRHARLFGYVKTDRNGRFELHTIKPSGYPGSELPAHIHVHIMAEGYRSYGTEFLFDDDERLVGDIRKISIKNLFIIAKPRPAESPFTQKFSYTIILKDQ